MNAFVTGPPERVTAPDGVQIACWSAGAGPAVLLVHGTTSDHTTFGELAPWLARSRTVVTFDRRGRGRSGDGADYRIEDEFRDVAAVIDHVAARQRAPVDVISHSFGAFVALGAALRTPQVRALVAYSPGFGAAYPPGSLDRIEQATASDDPDMALQVMFRDIIGMPEQEIASMRQSPVWQVRIAVAGTVGRECRADEAFLRRYEGALASLATPVLVLSGAANSGQKREGAARLAGILPRCVLREMPGQGHAAHHFAPGELAGACLDFFGDPQSAAAQASSPAAP